jgi:hypothetical protein
MLLVPSVDEAISHIENRLSMIEGEIRHYTADIYKNERYKGGERSNATAGQSGRLSNTEYRRRIALAQGQVCAFNEALEVLKALQEQEGKDIL